MSAGILAAAAALLGLERACYVWIARRPAGFLRLCARPSGRWLGEPVVALGGLFVGFKVAQAAIFAWWWAAHSGAAGPRLSSDPLALALGATLILAGQGLNAGVFYRLGLVGVFYGDRFGYVVPWCRAFPFSVLSHPQYVGAVLTIWGVFLAMALPPGTWYLLPAIETVYYAVGARLETARPPGAGRAPRRWWRGPASTRAVGPVPSALGGLLGGLAPVLAHVAGARHAGWRMVPSSPARSARLARRGRTSPLGRRARSPEIDGVRGGSRGSRPAMSPRSAERADGGDADEDGDRDRPQELRHRARG